MLWIKRNLFLAISGLVALALLAGGSFYVYSGLGRNNELSGELVELDVIEIVLDVIRGGITQSTASVEPYPIGVHPDKVFGVVPPRCPGNPVGSVISDSMTNIHDGSPVLRRIISESDRISNDGSSGIGTLCTPTP